MKDSTQHESLSDSKVKGWSWGELEVSKKGEKLHSESVQHYLLHKVEGVLINLGALCIMVGNLTRNSPKSQMRSCLHIG